MIEKEIKLTSCDVLPDSTVKPSSLQKYMQQLAREDLAHYGISYYEMRDDNLVFVLVRLAIEIYEPMRAEETFKFTTWEKEIKAATFIREFTFERDGKIVCAATTHWVLMNFTARTIARPSGMYNKGERFPDRTSGVCADKYLFGRNESFCFEHTDSHTVRYTELDENNHLNNSVYPDIVMNSVPPKGNIRRIQINFLSEAKLSERLTVLWSEIGGVIFARINSENDGKTRIECKIEYSADL